MTPEKLAHWAVALKDAAERVPFDTAEPGTFALATIAGLASQDLAAAAGEVAVRKAMRDANERRARLLALGDGK